MEKEFSEELTTRNQKPKINLYLLIISISIIVILIVIIIVLSIKLNNKSDDYDDLKNKYENQNKTLNGIFQTFQNLISTTNITHSDILKENFTKVREKVKSAISLEEGTYDFVSLDSETFDKGYSVIFETPSRNAENYYSEDEYDNMVYKLSCLFGKNAHIAVYENNPHISFYIEDKNLSFSMAALFNQKTIWDWEVSEDIPNPFYMPDFYLK